VVPGYRPLRRVVAFLAGIHNGTKAMVRLLRRRRHKRGPYTILITGASTGVGLELARLLLESDHRLVLTARAESMERFWAEGILEGPRVMFVQLDVTDDAQRRAAIAAVEARWGGIDVLVNNAGISYRSVTEHVTDAERIAQMDANFLGPMALTRLVLPYMRSHRFGRIINVSSVGGMTAMPTMSIYSASKFALEGASESLWYEMRPWGIRVSLVRPGFINSDGFRKVRYTGQGESASHDLLDPYHAHYANMSQLIEALMTLTFHTPRDIAETIFETIERKNPPLWISGTWDAFLFDLLRRFLPSSLYHRLLYAGLPRIWEWGPGDTPHPKTAPPPRPSRMSLPPAAATPPAESPRQSAAPDPRPPASSSRR
jgi:NAD(P)-dependent dehydrogenase (short-subunit alcohol dehydrogenase family)